MIVLAITPLSKLLFPDVHPDLWACPIQQGIPYFVNLAMSWLSVIAALAFLYGVISSSIGYMTAYGNEEKVKKAKQTLQWTIIGAILIMMSVIIINLVTNTFVDTEGNNTDLNKVKPTANCLTVTPSEASQQAEADREWWEWFRWEYGL